MRVSCGGRWAGVTRGEQATTCAAPAFCEACNWKVRKYGRGGGTTTTQAGSGGIVNECQQEREFSGVNGARMKRDICLVNRRIVSFAAVLPFCFCSKWDSHNIKASHLEGSSLVLSVPRTR